MTTRVGINGFGRIGRSFTRPSDTAGRDRSKALGMSLLMTRRSAGTFVHRAVPCSGRSRNGHGPQPVRTSGPGRSGAAVPG
jgi:hypothetical protein